MTTKALGEARITFDLERTATLCDVEPQRLRNWISDGVIEPAIAGTRGRGKAHRFSAQQIIGLAAAVSMSRSLRGCSHEFFQQVFSRHANWKWSAVEQFLGLRNDAWSKEAFAAALSPTTPSPIHIGDEDMLVDLAETLMRVRGALREAIKEHPTFTNERMKGSRSK